MVVYTSPWFVARLLVVNRNQIMSVPKGMLRQATATRINDPLPLIAAERELATVALVMRHDFRGVGHKDAGHGVRIPAGTEGDNPFVPEPFGQGQCRRRQSFLFGQIPDQAE